MDRNENSLHNATRSFPEFNADELLVLEPPKVNKGLKYLRGAEVTSGLEPYSGEWSNEHIKHLINRTLFGFTKERLSNFKKLSMAEAVEQIISESPLPAPPVNNYTGFKEDWNEDEVVQQGNSWVEAPYESKVNSYRIYSLQGWIIQNILQQESTIQEKMTLFWHNLLVTEFSGVGYAQACYQYYKLLYENALGNYKTLIRLLSVEPAMLKYLNGQLNTNTAPDENYGRELQELFCIGKGEGSGYTEEDVREAARILTGWRINYNSINNEGPVTSYFAPSKHDTGDKQFSAFYNNKVIKGRTGDEGQYELDELIDMIFSVEETAKYICRRIYSFFVFNEITDFTEQNIIAPLAKILRFANYEIKPVLKILLKSSHFNDELNRSVFIKSPAEHLLGLMQAINITTEEDGNLVMDFEKHWRLILYMNNLGMKIGYPPNVAGWLPYYQAPQYDKAWINTTTITRRSNYTDALVSSGLYLSSSRRLKANLIDFVKTLDKPEDPNELLNEAVFILLGCPISEEVFGSLKEVLLSGQQTDYYWTSAWNDYLANPEDDSKKTVVENRLKYTFKKLLQLGEFHLM